MNSKEMELKIYQELKGVIQSSKLNGRQVKDEMISGNYLYELSVRKEDEKLFNKVVETVKNDMYNGFNQKTNEASFVMKKIMLGAKFGSFVNRNIINGFTPRIEQLKKEIGIQDKSVIIAMQQRPRAKSIGMEM